MIPYTDEHTHLRKYRPLWTPPVRDRVGWVAFSLGLLIGFVLGGLR